MRKSIAVLSLALLVSVLSSQGKCEEQDYNNQLLKWQSEHAASLARPDGWLAVVALNWLKAGDNSFGTAPDDSIRLQAPGNAHLGIIHVEQDRLLLKAPANGFPADLQVDGHAAGEQDVVVDGPHATKFTFGTLTFFTIRRGDQVAMRVRDSQSPARLGFHGLKWFPSNPSFKIEAEWIPLAEPKEVNIQNVVGIATKGLVPGVAHFKLQGEEISLEPTVQSLTEDSLLFVIRDATSGKTTYAASRFLHTGLPDHGLLKPGKIILDFNRLENPPCAFTPYATCPLPPESNRLKIALVAGELRYDH